MKNVAVKKDGSADVRDFIDFNYIASLHVTRTMTIAEIEMKRKRACTHQGE